MIYWLLILSVACTALLLTGALRRYALARSLLDVPTQRSSHNLPTPLGGGIAIVLAFLLGLTLLVTIEPISANIFWALLGAGAWIALIGFLDDRQHIAARWRLLAHFAGAAWALFWLGGLPSLSALGFTLQLGWFGHVLGTIYLVWLLNLYNFMDGIDGIAGIEALTVTLGGSLLYIMSSTPGDEWVLPILLLAAVAGFLLWNFPSAKIFMGDAGSGFIGIVLGLMSIQAAWVKPELFWGWLILLGVFMTDATVTLARRYLRGEKVYQAHRSHAYQYAARRLGSHIPVTLVVGLINLFWLLPMALLVALKLVDGVFGVLLAYTPLLLLALRYKAGASDQQEY